MAGLYIHIPFCKQACHYCDFHFSTNLGAKSEIITAITNEIDWQKDYVGQQELKTIYFGGGTPSLLSVKELEIIFKSITAAFKVHPKAEITLEANPDDLTLEKLRALKGAGINRLSIGIQSFDDKVLTFLNRAHNRSLAINSVEDARRVGFTNISIDLIYAIPGQDVISWRKNIQQALLLSPEHISSYSLTIEDKTVFGKWSAQGKLKIVEDDNAAVQLEILMEELERAGFDQYEISNFGKPGFYSNHNSNYWKQENYLGVGPSAHSYNGHSRQYNVSNNYSYLQSMKKGSIPFELEVLSREDQINEYLLTTLRTQWGSNLTTIQKQFNYDLKAVNTAYLNNLQQQGFVVIDNHNLILTKKGRLLADKIASDLFLLTA